MLCVPLLVSWGNVQTLCVDSLTAGAVVQCVPTQSVGTRSHSRSSVFQSFLVAVLPQESSCMFSRDAENSSQENRRPKYQRPRRIRSGARFFALMYEIEWRMGWRAALRSASRLNGQMRWVVA